MYHLILIVVVMSIPPNTSTPRQVAGISTSILAEFSTAEDCIAHLGTVEGSSYAFGASSRPDVAANTYCAKAKKP